MVLRRTGRSKLATSIVAFIACLVVASVGPAKAQEAAAKPAVAVDADKPQVESKRRSTAELLPASTRLWISMEDLRRLEKNIANTQIGKLARQDTLAPFFASFEKQLRDSLDSNGIKFGLDVASVETMEANEVAFAGVLPDVEEGVKPAPGSHGIVVLIDVSPNVLAAEDFLDDAAEKMKGRGAKLEEIEVLGAKVSKFTIEVEAAKIKRTQASFVALIDGWMLASDNQSIFANVVRRIKSKERASGILADYEPFTTVRQKTEVEGVRPDIAWYVDPLGYARFADALAEEKADMRQPKDRPLEALSKEGLDALKAAGGFVSFSTGKHDVLHRSLVYANPKKAKAAAQKRLFNLLDFAPEGSSVAEVPNWVPADAAGYATFTWDINKAFNNVGPFFDTIAGEGAFEDILNDFKEVPAFRVDIRKMVQSLGNRITVIAKTEEPIDEASEKMIVGIPLVDGVDEKWLIESIGKVVKGKVKTLGGFTTVTDDRLEPEDDQEFDLDIDDDLGLDDDEEEADEPAPRVTLFNRRIFVIRNGYLFICNDKDYLKKFLARKPSDTFAKSEDFVKMNLALAELSDSTKVRFRMFNQLAMLLKTNYEMLRTGRMAESETFMARILNQAYGQEGSNDTRDQQIDGSALPADYDKEIAPFLGHSGWVMETTDSGWRFSGAVLPKEKAKAKVAEAPESSK